MKFKAIPYFSIILILLVPANAFGDSVNVSVDLPIFTDADKIVIFGNVSTETILQIIIILGIKITQHSADDIVLQTVELGVLIT